MYAWVIIKEEEEEVKCVKVRYIYIYIYIYRKYDEARTKKKKWTHPMHIQNNSFGVYFFVLVSFFFFVRIFFLEFF